MKLHRVHCFGIGMLTGMGVAVAIFFVVRALLA
jgi:hypothetical protein